MELLDGDRNSRILVVDDNEAIHEDFEKILRPSKPASAAHVDELTATLFHEPSYEPLQTHFELRHALQGQEAFQLVFHSLAAGKPFALAFVDIRMPPGWNGIETVERIWEHDREIEIVLCTACSDVSWEEISRRLRHPERLLILRKPFDPIEVRQLAYGLTAKWFLRRQATCRMQDLEIMVEERLRELDRIESRSREGSFQKNASRPAL